MGLKRSSLLCSALVLVFSSAIHAFDIAKLLGQYQEFSTFNKYLTETKLADQVNSRNTITVLAVENGALSAISGKSSEAIKAIISTHVILDYYDEKKLMEAQGSSEQLTTLFQASGLAQNQQGFLKVQLIGEGEIAFGSAVSGALVDAELVKTVTTEPYNISILQVTKPIVFPGADSAKAAKAPLASQNAKAPSKSAKAPVSSSPNATSPSEDVTADSPSTETAVESPKAAEAPELTAPTPAMAQVPAPGPAADEAPAADTPASSSSSSKMSLVGAVMGFASLLIVL